MVIPRTLIAGVVSEEIVIGLPMHKLKYLTDLPNNYIALNQIEIRHSGQQKEIDLLMLDPKVYLLLKFYIAYAETISVGQLYSHIQTKITIRFTYRFWNLLSQHSRNSQAVKSNKMPLYLEKLTKEPNKT